MDIIFQRVIADYDQPLNFRNDISKFLDEEKKAKEKKKKPFFSTGFMVY